MSGIAMLSGEGNRVTVRGLRTDPNDAPPVRTALVLARGLDPAVVAEGMDTTGQQACLSVRRVPAQVLPRAVGPAL